MTDPNGFGVGDLGRIAATIGGGADGLGGATAPEAPDAGVSSAAVGSALASLSAVVAKITRTAAVAQQQLSAGQQSYQDTDSTWQSAFTAPDGEGEPR
jgi:hypothetical protein